MKTMNAKKRLFSLLLCVAMLFSLCPQTVFASAGAGTVGNAETVSTTGHDGNSASSSETATYAVDESSSGTETHTHCVCGADHTAIGDHTDEKSITFEAWPATDTLPVNVNSDKQYYYLTEDVTLSGTWSAPSGIVLCLNGHSITVTSANDVIRIGENRTFTLTDCKTGDNQGKVTHDSTRNTSPSRGVWIHKDATFNMYGGCITGNSAYSGSGVYVNTDAVFRLYGGSIRNNSTSNDDAKWGGGGVCLTNGKFYMYGGTISGNSADTIGGGVYVWNNSLFNMYGGTISDNGAGAGGGVYISGDYKCNSITLSGDAKITGNSAGAGGGVYVSSGYKYDSITLSGNAQITGNTLTGDNPPADNVYLDSGKTIKVESDFTGSVGITTATSPTVSAPVTVLDASTDLSAVTGKFTFDANSNYYFDDSGQMAVTPCDTHSYENGVCTVCGSVCPHDNVNTGTNQCEVCKAALTAMVKHTEENVTYYADLNTAIEAAGTGDTVTLLDGVTGTFSCTSKDFILDLNGKALSGLTVSGTAIKIRDSATGGKITLTAKDGVNVSDLLETGYAFKSESTWYDKYNNSTAPSITNAEVSAVPISGVSIAATGDTTPVYGYTEAPTFTATPTGTAAGATYKWYVGDAEQTGNASTFTFPAGKSVGTYNVRCEVTADDYAAIGEASVTVTKTTLKSTDYTAPTAKPGVTYPGSGSLTKTELINEGTFSNTIPNGPIFRYGQRGSDGITNWDNAQWSYDAGTYTVCWYIEGGANYEDVGSSSDPAGSIEVKIDPKPVTPAVTVSDGTLTYDGTEKKPTVTVKDGETTIPEDEYTVAYSNNVNAGTATVTVTDRAGGNYAIETATADFTINRAGYGGTTAADGSAPYGATGEVDLSALIAAGGTLTVGAVTDTNSVLYTDGGMPKPEGNKLQFAFKDDSTLIGRTVAVPVNVSGCTNYSDYTITVTLTVSDKQIPTVTVNPISREYSGAALTDAVITGETGGVNGTWSWKDGKAPKDVADSTSDSNTWTVVFTPDDTAKYKPVEKTVNVTVNPRGVTISGLSAKDKTYDGTTAATVTGTAVIDGKIGNDAVTVQTGTAAFADKNVGTGKTVTFSGYSLTGADAENYRLTAQPAAATADIAPKSVTVSGVTAAGRAYKENDKTVALSGGTVDGVLNGDTVTADLTAAIGTMETPDTDDTPKSVTVSGVQLTGADAENYVLSAQPAGVTVSISRIAYNGTTTATGSAKYGGSNAVDLSSLIMSGGRATVGTASDGNGILNTCAIENDTSLSFSFKDTAAVDDTATVTVNVSDCTNYTDYTLAVTLTVRNRDVPVVTAPTAVANLTYNGTPQTLITAGTTSGGTLQYSTDNSTWSAELPKAENAATYTVYYRVVGNADYADTAVNSISVAIGRKAVTVKPKSYTITTGNAIPAFVLEYVGLADGDTLNGAAVPAFICREADGNTAVSTSTAAGSYTIAWTNSDAFNFDSETNYTVTKVATGTLTISASPDSDNGSSASGNDAGSNDTNGNTNGNNDNAGNTAGSNDNNGNTNGINDTNGNDADSNDNADGNNTTGSNDSNGNINGSNDNADGNNTAGSNDSNGNDAGSNDADSNGTGSNDNTGNDTNGNANGNNDSNGNTNGNNGSNGNTNGINDNDTNGNTNGNNDSNGNINGTGSNDNADGNNTTGSNDSNGNTAGSNDTGSNDSNGNTAGSNDSNGNDAGSNDTNGNDAGSNDNADGNNTTGSNDSNGNDAGSNDSNRNDTAWVQQAEGPEPDDSTGWSATGKVLLILIPSVSAGAIAVPLFLKPWRRKSILNILRRIRKK